MLHHQVCDCLVLVSEDSLLTLTRGSVLLFGSLVITTITTIITYYCIHKHIHLNLHHLLHLVQLLANGTDAVSGLLGLINNVLYAIILSAALDLVGPTLPKSLVLLFDILPCFVVKLFLPYFIHTIPYHVRILILVLFSFIGMQFVAYAPSLGWRMFGVVLASTAAGTGELSFVGLTHYYGHFALASWSSGTGAAGLAGAGMYSVVITWWRWSVRSSLAIFSLLPIMMLVSFFGVLPRGVLHRRKDERDEDEEETDVERMEAEGLLGRHSPIGARPASIQHASKPDFWYNFKHRLLRIGKLFFPYMLPFFLVFFAEYAINQGVSPTLLFGIEKPGGQPVPSPPFEHFRDFYPTYSTIYQFGVFISRSSHLLVRIRDLYTPSLLQCLNLAILILQALFPYFPNVYFVFLVIFWEGLLGGAVYVNTLAKVSEDMSETEREFSLGAVTVADSGGACIAGFVGLWLEGVLCRFQIERGREWCTLMD